NPGAGGQCAPSSARRRSCASGWTYLYDALRDFPADGETSADGYRTQEVPGGLGCSIQKVRLAVGWWAIRLGKSLPSRRKDVMKHRSSQLAGEGILLAGMV